MNLPSGTIFSKLFHSMQALKTELFLLILSLTFGIIKDRFESLKLGTNKLHSDTGHLNFIKTGNSLDLVK